MIHGYRWIQWPCMNTPCVTWRTHVSAVTHSCVWHDSFVCVTWRIYMCGVAHLYVWRDAFVRVTWLIRMCDLTRPHVWHDSSTFVTWLIHMCDMTDPHVWRNSFTYATGLFTCVTWRIFKCGASHSYVSHVTCDTHTYGVCSVTR